MARSLDESTTETRCIFCGGTAQQERSSLDVMGRPPVFVFVRCTSIGCQVQYHPDSSIQCAPELAFEKQQPDEKRRILELVQQANKKAVPITITKSFEPVLEIIAREREP